MSSNATPHNPHDKSYKDLFSHPEMVRDLIVGFLPAEWVQDFDLSTLERNNGHYVTDDLRERENDIIWRVRFRGEWLYLYILLEFQSSVDRFMAVRLLTYMGLLYQDLIKTKQLTDDGLLPPLLPIVLYNGEPRWTAAQSLHALIAQPSNGLQRYLPQLEYLLLDEGAIVAEGLPNLQNLAALLMGLEKSQTLRAVQHTLDELINATKQPELASLQQSFMTWLKQVLLPGRLKGITLPNVNHLLEVKKMLAENTIDWGREFREEGWLKGMLKGKLEGKLEGEALILQRQLTKRFGTLSDSTLTRLHSATSEQLELWADRVLDAPTLQEVFG